MWRLIWQNRAQSATRAKKSNSTYVSKMAMRAYLTAFILFLINLLNYMDRYTVAGVLTSIETYYKLTHSQSGLLQTAFIASYMIFAPIFGYLGDRYSRKLNITFGILFWSLTTFSGSLIPAEQPLLFFAMRALVGIGEASYSTIAPTIIADLFPPAKRSQMLAFFYFAIPVGSGLGYTVGSSAAAVMGDWKWALRVTPPLGIACVVLLIFLVREPKRGESEGANQTDEETSLKEDLKYIVTVHSCIWSTIGFTCVTFAVGALSWWAPTYMMYAYDVAKDKRSEEWIGFIFGIIACVGGIIGVVTGVSVAQYYKRYDLRADPLVCAYGVLLAVPAVVLCLVVAHRSPSWSWLLIFVGITFLSTNWSIVADMLLYVITPKRRSLAQALQILISHLLGDATSPFVIGLISDQITSGETAEDKYWSLQYSLYLTPFVLVFGGLAFLYTAAFITQDRDQCKVSTQSNGYSEKSNGMVDFERNNGFHESIL